MGYTIHYSPQTKRKYPLHIKNRNVIRGCFLILLSAALLLAIKYRAECMRILLPGDPDVTSNALRTLVLDMRDGNAKTAVATFCREIIDHAA